MAFYQYEVEETGDIVELFITNAERERREKNGKIMLDDGRTGIRRIDLEHSGHKDTPGNWPQKCWALGVTPDRIGEAREVARQSGVPTEFSRDGDPIFTSKKHRTNYIRKVSGLVDRSGFD